MNRLATGSQLLVRRYRIWLLADGPKPAAARISGGLAALGFTTGVCIAHPLLAIPALAIYGLCAWCTTAPATPETAPDSDRTDDTEAFVTRLHELIPGPDDRAHLTQIADRLYGDPKATGRVRKMCDAADITITRSIRAPGAGISTGIHHRDLPPLPQPLPEGAASGAVAVVAPGQPADNTQQQQQQPGARIVPDPDRGEHAWTVIWDDQPTRQAS